MCESVAVAARIILVALLGWFGAVARDVPFFGAVVALGRGFGVVYEVQVLKFTILLVPKCCPVITMVSVLVGYKIPEIYVICLYCFKLIQFREIGDVLLILKKFVCFVGFKMEACLEEIIPNRHPVVKVANSVTF